MPSSRDRKHYRKTPSAKDHSPTHKEVQEHVFTAKNRSESQASGSKVGFIISLNSYICSNFLLKLTPVLMLMLDLLLFVQRLIQISS